MKLLITCGSTDSNGYQHFYDIEKKQFVENYLDTLLDKPRKFKQGTLPIDLANAVILEAFLLALLHMEYDSALRLLMISRSTHMVIAKHFKVRKFQMFSIVKLASTMIDVTLSEMGQPFAMLGIDFNTDVQFPQPRDVYEDCKIQIYFTQSEISNVKVKTYQTGPTMLDSALLVGHFATGICASTFFGAPFILFRVLGLEGENVISQHCISNQWRALSKLLSYCLGRNFKLLIVVTTSGVDRIINVPTSANQPNNPISFTFT